MDVAETVKVVVVLSVTTAKVLEYTADIVTLAAKVKAAVTKARVKLMWL